MISTKSGLMKRSPSALDRLLVKYEAATFREEGSNVIYVTVSRDTYYEHQTTVHVRAIVNDTSGTAFIVDADTYDHYYDYSITYVCEHERGIASNWIVALKEILGSLGFHTVIGDGLIRLEDVYASLLTKRIFNNVVKNLDVYLDELPDDIIEVVKNMDLKNEGLDKLDLVDPGKKENEVWPFVVQDIDGFSKRPQYRVVTRKQAQEDLENGAPWGTILDME